MHTDLSRKTKERDQLGWKGIITVDLKGTGRRAINRTYLFRTGTRLTGFCEHANEPSDSIRFSILY
jgi:hypothetical protein